MSFTNLLYMYRCLSYVGCIGGSQEIVLGNYCLYSRGSISHEICHALGLWHEQSRPDRDDYISVSYENILPTDWHNFMKLYSWVIDSQGVPYDYGSIMQYSCYVS